MSKTMLTAAALLACGTNSALAQTENYALQFTGTEYVEGINTFLPDGDERRTIEAWIQPTSTAVGTIFNWGQAGINGRFGLLYVSQRLYLVGEYHDFVGTTIIPTNVWTHVAITYDGTQPRLYVNGEADTVIQRFGDGPFNTGGSLWRMGAGSGTLSEWFAGAIDEVKVWTYARSPSEVRLDMLVETCANPAVVAYYDFNSGARQTEPFKYTLPDRSQSQSNGTLVNFAEGGQISSFVPGAPVCKSGNAKCVIQAAHTYFGAKASEVVRLYQRVRCAR